MSCTFLESLHVDDEPRDRMRYHTLVINVCCHDLATDMSSTRTEDAPDLANYNTVSGAINTALSSAREIAALVQAYRTMYGLEYAHQFAMYAINVSLFCMLVQEDFDILDPDFIGLTSAFSIIACRSQVGRHLFHAFKLSVRSRNQSGQMHRTDDLPPGMKELFGAREDFSEPDKWDHYAEGLAGVDGEPSFLAELSNDLRVPGLHDMLRWYERLSIGKDIKWKRDNREPAF